MLRPALDINYYSANSLSVIVKMIRPRGRGQQTGRARREYAGFSEDLAILKKFTWKDRLRLKWIQLKNNRPDKELHTRVVNSYLLLSFPFLSFSLVGNYQGNCSYLCSRFCQQHRLEMCMIPFLKGYKG